MVSSVKYIQDTQEFVFCVWCRNRASRIVLGAKTWQLFTRTYRNLYLFSTILSRLSFELLIINWSLNYDKNYNTVFHRDNFIDKDYTIFVYCNRSWNSINYAGCHLKRLSSWAPTAGDKTAFCKEMLTTIIVRKIHDIM